MPISLIIGVVKFSEKIFYIYFDSLPRTPASACYELDINKSKTVKDGICSINKLNSEHSDYIFQRPFKVKLKIAIIIVANASKFLPECQWFTHLGEIYPLTVETSKRISLSQVVFNFSRDRGVEVHIKGIKAKD